MVLGRLVNAVGNTTGRGWTNGIDAGHVRRSEPRSAPTRRTRSARTSLFQYHHQPFNYFANYAPGTPGRTHLQDEADFSAAQRRSSKGCDLKAVSFIKPVGEENEHPGYASTPNGNDHLVELLQSIENSGCAKDTMVIVTYDEFGGQWDHVTPPGEGAHRGAHDQFGPGTRIPALDRLAGPPRQLRRRSHAVRHDVDPRDDRAAVESRAAQLARREQ